MSGTFNHLMTIGFSVRSNHPQGEDITPAMLRTALLKRIYELDRHNEWAELLMVPVDTYEEEEQAA